MNCFSLSSRGAFSLFLASVLIALFAAGCGESSGGSGGGAGSDRFPSIRDATPLPRSTPEELGIEPSVGDAIVATPIPALELEPHPFLNNDGNSRIHNDHYNSATYDRSGPVGPNIDITTHQLGNLTGICAMMTFLENGYVLGSCFESDDLKQRRQGDVDDVRQRELEHRSGTRRRLSPLRCKRRQAAHTSASTRTRTSSSVLRRTDSSSTTSK